MASDLWETEEPIWEVGHPGALQPVVLARLWSSLGGSRSGFLLPVLVRGQSPRSPAAGAGRNGRTRLRGSGRSPHPCREFLLRYLTRRSQAGRLVPWSRGLWV